MEGNNREQDEIQRRIERLLNQPSPELEKNSNCFGTLLYVLGIEDHPVFAHASELEKHIRQYECGKENGCIVAFYDQDNALAHCGTYVGKEDGQDMMFHQFGNAGPYSKDPIACFTETFQELSYLFYKPKR